MRPDALRRTGVGLVVATSLLVAGCLDAGGAGAQELPEARELFLTGQYEEAEAMLRGAEEARGGAARPAELLLLGRILRATGRLEEASGSFTRAAEADGGVGLLAELHRGEVLLSMGERDEAFRIFDGFIDVYNRSPSLDSRGLLAVAGAVRHLGARDPALFQDALRAYDEAVEADPTNLEAHLGTGELFLDRFNAPDARAAFRRVLEQRADHPEGLLGMARVAAFEGLPEAGVLVDQALQANPRLVGALVLRARLHAASEDLASARADLERALEIDPTDSEALALEAGLLFLAGDRAGFDRIGRTALERNPVDGAFFETAAELVARSRHYAEAAMLAGRGVEVDSLAWGARATRGLNRLRIGDMEAGRADLDAAFGGDPYNVRVKNTLDLLDVMDGFEEWESPNVRLLLDPEDGEALAIYMLEVAERARAEMGELYGTLPPSPIRIEAFRRRADFSVRTVGLTGLGALGVSFGPVLAMESPSARGIEGFHWASVLWHEMAHAFHLAITEHRVPRWFTEGLSVREERRAAPGWGARPTLPFLEAWLDDRLRPPSELSRSFVRPRYPEEVQYAYVLGSLVVEWMEGEWGFPRVLAVLDAFREGRSTGEALRRHVGLDAEELDAAFEAWFRARYEVPLAAARASARGRELAAPGGGRGRAWMEDRITADERDLEAHLALGRLYLEEGGPVEAQRHLEAARDLFPENPDAGGPDPLLARLARERGDEAGALEALRRHLAVAGGNHRAWLAAAELHEALGDPEGAAEALEAAILVYPFDPEVHDRLARLYHEVGEAEAEVRERRAVLALEPVDRAGALYRLGEAQLRAGQLEDARRSALEALELAPRFGEAQDLLLRIMDAISHGGPGEGR